MRRDRVLRHALGALPDSALQRLVEHLRTDRGLVVEYGWDWGHPDRPAYRGCVVGIAMSPAELAKATRAEGDDFLWLAEEIFPGWASGWVDRPDQELPGAALEVVRTAVTELMADRTGA